jgi:Zn-dependent protease
VTPPRICAFNLLPLPPLDGSAILEGLLPDKHAQALRELQSNAMMSMLGLIVAWRVFPIVTGPIFAVLLRLVHPFDAYS